jgi:hypothetical protein
VSRAETYEVHQTIAATRQTEAKARIGQAGRRTGERNPDMTDVLYRYYRLIE